MEKKDLSKVFHALFSDAESVGDAENGMMTGGFATLSSNQMLKLKGGTDGSNNGNCGNCGNCGGCPPPDNNGNCGNCGTCNTLLN